MLRKIRQYKKSYWIAPITFFVTLFTIAYYGGFLPPLTRAVVITWDGGGGADTNWSNPLNWSTDGVPGAGDDVIFNSTSTNNSTIDSAFAGTVLSISINAGYTGTITQARALTVSGTFSQAAGTFTGGSQTITVDNFTLSGGTFTATSGQLTIAGNFTHSGSPIFNHNNGTVSFDNSCLCNKNIDVNVSLDFYHIKFNNGNPSWSHNIAAGDTLNALNLLTFTSGGYGGTGKIAIPSATADLSVATNGGLTSTGVLEITGAATKTWTIGAGGLLPNVILNAANVTINFTSTTTTSTLSSLNLDAGTFNVSNAPVTIDGNVDIDGGALIHGTKTFIQSGSGNVFSLDGTGSTITAGSGTFNTSNYTQGTIGAPTFTGGSGPMTVGGYLTLNAGVFTATTGTLTINGAITKAAGATYTHNNGSVLVQSSNGANVTHNMSGATFYNLEFDKSGSWNNILTSGNIVVVAGTLTLTAGGLNTGDLHAQGNIFQKTTFNGGSTIITINGSGAQSWTGNGTTAGSLNDIVINKAAGTLTIGDATNPQVRITRNFTYTQGTVDATTFNSTAWFGGTGGNLDGQGTSATMAFDNVNFQGAAYTLAGNLDVNGNVTLSGGTLDVSASNYQINVAENWTYSSGTFTPRSGTVILDGANQIIAGANTFSGFTKNVSSGATLTFPASTTTTISGTMTLQGAAGQLLSLRSSINATQATINPQGTRTIDFLDVKDINNSNATAIDTRYKTVTNSGNNTNWTFYTTIGFSSGSASGSESTTSVPITISLNTSGSTLSVDYAVTGGTAGTTDYTLASGTATITNPSTSTTITLAITNDTVFEGNETVIITLSNASGGDLNSSDTFTYTITDNDAPFVDLATATTLSQTNWDGGVGVSATNQFNSQTNINSSTNGQFALAGASPWYSASWSYRRKITIDNTKVDAALTNFPVLITQADLSGTDFWSKAKSDGSDIVVTSSNGTTKLNRQLVSIDTGAQTLELWVNVSSLADSADTDIYLYYGNASAAETNSTATWDTNYKLVQHMNQNPGGSAPQLTDSTSNANNCSMSGAMVAGDSQAGQVGNGVRFDGINDQFNCTTGASTNITGDITFEAWLKYVDNGAYQGMLVRGLYAYVFTIDTLDRPAFYRTGWLNGTSTLVTNTWYHITMVSDGSVMRFYVNGAAAGTATAQTGTSSASSPALISGWSGSNWLNGILDEVRLTNGTRSAGWISTTYNNQSNPGTFYATAAEESGMQASGSLTSAIFDAGSAANSWGVMNYNSTNGTGTSVKVRTSNAADMTGATAFSSCTEITNGTDISSNSCVTDGHRYIQYQVNLTRMNNASATFQDISIKALGAATATVAETAGTATVTATLSAVSAQTVTIPYTVTGTATNPSHHNLASGNITINAGSLTGSVTFTIVNNTTYEVDKTVIVTMGTPTNAVAGQLNARTITIQNDDANVSGFINTVSPPADLLLTPFGDGSGNIKISMRIADAESNAVKLKVEYKLGTCALYAPQKLASLGAKVVSSNMGGDAIAIQNNPGDGYNVQRIYTGAGPNTVSLTWLSQMDIPAANEQACIFVTAHDATGASTVESAAVRVDNLPPSSPGALSLQSITTTAVTFVFGSPSADTNFKNYSIYYVEGLRDVTPVNGRKVSYSANNPSLGYANYDGAARITIQDLEPGTSYAANIWAFDTSGNMSSSPQEIAFKTRTLGEPSEIVNEGTDDMQPTLEKTTEGLTDRFLRKVSGEEYPIGDASKAEFIDLGSVPAAMRKNILAIVKRMLEKKTYVFPKNKRYGPWSVTKGKLALQMTLAVGSQDCGSPTEYRSIYQCADKAKQKKIIDSNFKTTKKITRIAYYEMLLKAKNIPLEEHVTVAWLEKKCADIIDPTLDEARIFFTAFKARIASKYIGKKCQLRRAFSRAEAAKFAVRAAQVAPVYPSETEGIPVSEKKIN